MNAHNIVQRLSGGHLAMVLTRRRVVVGDKEADENCNNDVTVVGEKNRWIDFALLG
jgi:hypothetical protein